MILNLYIENIAVIEKASINFLPGFNVMTGETGAGKSIVIDSINLILGHRAPKDIIRTGCDKAFVSATFDNLSPKVVDLIQSMGYETDEDGVLLIQREISLNGKGSCRINSRPATVTTLKNIGGLLINIHGQHETYGLLSSETHIGYIDSIGDMQRDLERYKKEYEKLKSIKHELDSLNIDGAEKARRIDLLKYQIEEIESANLIPNEYEELKELKNMYANSEKISDAVLKAKSALGGDEISEGAISLVESVSDVLSEIVLYLKPAEKLQKRLQEIFYELEDCSVELTDIFSSIEYDPNELQRVEERLDIIYRLTRKYGSSVDEVIEYFEESKRELGEIEFSETRVEELNILFKQVKKKAVDIATAISEKRRKISNTFSKQVREELEFLAMPGVQLCISQQTGNLGERGFDVIEFLISTNPGEPPKSISKIASGGELSRIMLAVKSVIADKDNIDTLIFDEIDTGISGSVAQKVGLKLKDVSKHRQVICVTHSAQIAALANEHFLINKNIKEGRTFTKVFPLDYEQRKNEIARIIGGVKITEATLANAEEMLKMGMIK